VQPAGESGSWLQRFLDWNRRLADYHWTPRLYPVTHVAALDYWITTWVGTDAFPGGRGALLEFGSGETFHLSRLVGQRFATRYATDTDDVPESCWPSDVVFRRCLPETLPFPSASMDVIVVRSVLEHVENPAAVFNELSRVLKPHGLLFANVPNKWDYVSVVARFAGSRKSAWLQHTVRPQWDDYPTFYRCNTRRSLTSFARAADLTVEVFRPLPSEPAYLRFFLPLYFLGAGYQFLISLFSIDALQPSFLAVLRKPGHRVPPATDNSEGEPSVSQGTVSNT
jgi:SAM-dependent methyltransferase